jgi:hypothetical protein
VTLAAALLVLGACGVPARAGAEEQAMAANGPTVTAAVVGVQPGRPPMQTLAVDVTLNNPGASPTWFFLPRNLPVSAGGVDGVAVYSGGGVTLGALQGNGGGWLACVAPGASLTVRGLEIGWWDAVVPGSISLATKLGSGASIGGEIASAWFGRDPVSRGEVRYSDLVRAGARHTPDRSEVPLVIEGAAEIAVSAAVSRGG